MFTSLEWWRHILLITFRRQFKSRGYIPILIRMRKFHNSAPVIIAINLRDMF
jgi:hypothetical protein